MDFVETKSIYGGSNRHDVLQYQILLGMLSYWIGSTTSRKLL